MDVVRMASAETEVRLDSGLEPGTVDLALYVVGEKYVVLTGEVDSVLMLVDRVNDRTHSLRDPPVIHDLEDTEAPAVREHLQRHLSDGVWHDSCVYCLDRRRYGATGVPAPVAIYEEVRAERQRAHAKHGDTSMESCPPDDYRRLAILAEELGEVAREFNDGHHRGTGPNLARLRKELIQVAAMAAAWADAIELGPCDCGMGSDPGMQHSPLCATERGA